MAEVAYRTTRMLAMYHDCLCIVRAAQLCERPGSRRRSLSFQSLPSRKGGGHALNNAPLNWSRHVYLAVCISRRRSLLPSPCVVNARTFDHHDKFPSLTRPPSLSNTHARRKPSPDGSLLGWSLLRTRVAPPSPGEFCHLTSVHPPCLPRQVRRKGEALVPPPPMTTRRTRCRPCCST